MKLSYQILKKLILEEVEKNSSVNKQVEELRDLLHDPDPEKKLENLIRAFDIYEAALIKCANPSINKCAEQTIIDYFKGIFSLPKFPIPKEIPEEQLPRLMHMLLHDWENKDAQNHAQELYKKAIYQHFRTEEGEHYSDDSFVDYYEMNNYLGKIYLGAVEIRTELEYPDDPIIDANVIGGSGHFLGAAGFAMYRKLDKYDERNLNRYLRRGEYEMYTYERIKEYLLTPNGKDFLLYYINNKT